MQTLRWDVFCRVIDNHGDLGVCWRLARQLAGRGQIVRLWVDDPAALSWMAPAGAANVELVRWTLQPPLLAPGDVVVEAFGCDPPAAFVTAMAQARPAPLWINLEYLSAEPYVERCHGLPSPQLSGPAHGLLKWFFYPGFNARTGGLLREDGLAEQRQAFAATAWLNAQGITTDPGERRISVFCYADAGLADFIDALPPTPTLWLLAPGAARQQVHEVLAASHRLAAWRCVDLPWLSQPDYDRLLWSCELNVVRGEDSLVQALWAGTAFVWQIYAQRDGAHAVKLRAFLDLYLRDAAPALAVPLRSLWLAFNRLAPGPCDWPDSLAWQAHAQAWRNRLWTQADLATQLLRFVEERR